MSPLQGASVGSTGNPVRLRLVHAGLAAVVAIGAAGLVTVAFAPRFVLWRGLASEYASTLPEVSRAADTLKQLRDPSARIDNPSNRVINNRLLFPVLGHLLGISPQAFLALPHLGCLLALAVIAGAARRETGGWRGALVVTVTIAATPWFFVSSGWLAYFDSWVVLALLTVALGRGRRLLAVAGLLAPWIDERYIVALPAALAARVVAASTAKERAPREVARDTVAAAAGVLPYLVFRVVRGVSGDGTTGSYLAATLAELRGVPALRLLDGAWSGFRVGWILIVAFVVLGTRRRPRLERLAIGLVVAATLAAALITAGDVSRSMSMLTPAALAGAFALHRWRPAHAGVVLLVVCAANLLLPARHVIWSSAATIEPIWVEVRRWQHPPAVVDPEAYVEQGRAALRAGRHVDALRLLDIAVRLDPHAPITRAERAIAHLAAGDAKSAAADIEEALAHGPAPPDAHYARAVMEVLSGDNAAALRHLDAALAGAGASWSRRSECEALRERIGGERGLTSR